MRQCVLFSPTKLCVSIIEYDPATDIYELPEEYEFAPDNTGEVNWTWDGIKWLKPTDILNSPYLSGYPTSDTPDLVDETDRLATTSYVINKIQDYINNVWLQDAVFNGGSFSDTVTNYNAGNFDGGGNLSSDLSSPDFTGSGGNLTTNIDGGTF